VKTDWIVKYIKENLFTAIGSLSLSLGGILFLIYFFHIDYMPSLDMGNSIHLLFGMALTGGWVLLWLSLMIMLPSLFGESLSKWKEKEWSERIFSIVMVCFGLLFSWVFILWILMNGDINKEAKIWISILVLAVLVVINVVIIKNQQYIQGFIVSIAALILLIYYVGNYSLISQVFMRNLHLGGFEINKMHIKKDSCSVLESYHQKIIWDDNHKRCSVEKIFVLLKLGKEMVMKIDNKNDANISISIPMDDILSYSWKNKSK